MATGARVTHLHSLLVGSPMRCVPPVTAPYAHGRTKWPLLKACLPPKALITITGKLKCERISKDSASTEIF